MSSEQQIMTVEVEVLLPGRPVGKYQFLDD